MFSLVRKSISWLVSHLASAFVFLRKNVLVDYEMVFVWRTRDKSNAYLINYHSLLVFIIFKNTFFSHLRIFNCIFTSIISISFRREVDHFTMCCHAKKSLPNLKCSSRLVSDVSTCDELLKYKALMYCIWLLGVMAILGNLVVIFWRIIEKGNYKVNSFLLVRYPL